MNAEIISSAVPQVGLLSQSSCMPLATATSRITLLAITVKRRF